MVLLANTLNSDIITLAIIGFVVIFFGLILKKLNQPSIVAYIISGIILGPSGFALITDINLIETLGELGLILLLFFIGMEISLPEFLKLWKTSLFGTLIQIAVSILFVSILGLFVDWNLEQIIVIGFVLSLSSSAVVIKLLEDKSEIKTKIGQNVISILLMQDMLIVPMLIITEYMSSEKPDTNQIITQIIGSILILLIMLWILKKKKIKMPFSKKFENDHELQIFVALLFSFGFAIFTAFLGLSAALGAFFAGIIVHAADNKEWFHNSLHPFRVSFVSMFFVSVGMLIDINFFLQNWIVISILVISAFISNHLINSFILQIFCRNWKSSLYGGAMLAQIGELSFIIAATAFSINVISENIYQTAIATISLTLLFSPLYILIMKSILKKTFTSENDNCGI